MFRHRFAGRLAGLVIAVLATATAPAWAQTGQHKIAIIDVQRIIRESAVGKAAIAKVQQLNEQISADLKAKQEDARQLQKRIVEGKMSLAEDKLKQMQAELEGKAIELDRAREDGERRLEKAQAEAFGPIEEQVMPIIQQVGKEGGYTLIFRKFESGLVYAADGIDITASVISRLDASKTTAPAGS